MRDIREICKTEYNTIEQIMKSDAISPSYKINAILWSTLENRLKLEDVEKYLREFKNKNSTDYRKLLCAYDYKKYGES